MISRPPLGSIVGRINHLINSLSKKKKTHVKSIVELEQLLKLCNPWSEQNEEQKKGTASLNMSIINTMNSNRVPIISALLDDLDFSDPRTISNKDDQKVIIFYTKKDTI